jgi:hypothetical protein
MVALYYRQQPINDRDINNRVAEMNCHLKNAKNDRDGEGGCCKICSL